MRADMDQRPLRTLTPALLLAAALAAAASGQPTPRFHRPAFAPGEAPVPRDKGEKLPPVMRGAQIKEKLDARIPQELVFRNASGERVELGRYFGNGRPVILNFAYFSCPMLCGLVRQSLTNALNQIELEPGESYEVLTISIDPDDGPKQARRKKNATLDRLSKPNGAAAWHFLTADDKKTVDALAKAVGWGYNYNEKRDEYAHSAAFLVATPSGRVSRYVYGIEYAPDNLRLSLVEASKGKVGSAWDKLVLYCCRYDPEAGGYSMVAMKVMRVAGGVTVALLVGGIGTALGVEFARRRRDAGRMQA